MCSHPQQPHLVVDDALAGDLSGAPPRAGARAGRVLATVPVPSGAVFRIEVDTPVEALLQRIEDPAGADDAHVVLQAVADGPHLRLLLLTPRGAAAPRVNGRRAPRVCLLRTGDQLLLESGRLLHVTVFDSPRIGAPAAAQRGMRCPICHTPIDRGRKDARVFTCPCGTAMHLDDPTHTPAEDCLECATLPAECPSCRQPIRLSGGFRYVPNFD